MGLPHGQRAGVEVSLLDNERRSIGPATGLRWRSSNDSVAVFENGQVIAGRPGRAVLTAATPWDSTATVDVVVAGDLVVSALREGRYDLYVLWSGGPPLPLTRDSAVETFAAWSPDHRQIAFAAGPPDLSRSNLFVMHADGSERRQLTTDSARLQFINWVRPAGGQLVFEWSRGGSSQIWSYDLSTNEPRQLTSGGVNSQPAVSPDGRRVAFLGSRETAPGRPRYGIYEMGLDGSGERELLILPGVSRPRYSPDGQTLYFIRSETVGRTQASRVWRVRIGAPADSAVAVTPAGTFVSSFSIGEDPSRMACQILSGPPGAEVSRVQILNVATGAFEDAPGFGPDVPASTPALRPAAAAAATPRN